MRLIRSILLLAGVAGTLSAQATTRPRTAVAGTVASRTAGADLVIDSLDLVLSRTSGASATVNGNGVQVKGLVLVARVTNRGTERWASRGAIGFSLKAGREEDRGEGRRAAGGVSTVPGQPSSGLGATVMAPFGPVNGEATIPGSLAPGESRVITLVVRNRADRAFVIFERDKYYTLEATIRTRGDVNEANDRSKRVGRFDAARERLVARWESLVVLDLPRGGSVQVTAPPRP